MNSDLSAFSTHALIDEVRRRAEVVKAMKDGDPIPAWFELDEQREG